MLRGASCCIQDGNGVGTFFRIESTGEVVLVKLKRRFKWSDPEGLLALDPQFVRTKQGSTNSKGVFRVLVMVSLVLSQEETAEQI